MSVTKRSQRGTTMVEMAIAVVFFFMLVFGIIEFALGYFSWARINEAARDGARYAIVNNPVTDISGLVCPGDSVEVACTSAECSDLLDVVHRVAPFATGDQVFVRYACGDAGNPARPAEMMIPEVTVELRGVEHEFIVPVLLGFPARVELPTARATRTGEDLFTEGSGG